MATVDIDRDVRTLGILEDVTVESSTAFPFDGELAGAIAVMTVALSAFGKAVAGKAAEATWIFLAKQFEGSLPADSKVDVVYRTAVRGHVLELVIRYPHVSALKRDRKMHRIYLAFAAGFALARLPEAGEVVSLMPLIATDTASPALDVSVRRAP